MKKNKTTHPANYDGIWPPLLTLSAFLIAAVMSAAWLVWEAFRMAL